MIRLKSLAVIQDASTSRRNTLNTDGLEPVRSYVMDDIPLDFDSRLKK